MRNRNLTKAFGLAGILLGEGYMLYTALAPRSSGEVVPLEHTLKVILVLGIYFGVFGGLVGTGIGLLVTGLLKKR